MIKEIYNHMFLLSDTPKNWSVGKVSDVVSNISTGLNPRDNFILGKGSIKYVTVKNLTVDGTIDFTNCDTIDEDARKIVHNRSDISTGDILFASIAPLGRCFLIQNTPMNWDINESVFSIRANSELISSEYLYSYFMSDYFITKAQSSSTGSIFKGIRIGTLLDMDIIIPTYGDIKLFTDTTAPLFRGKQRCFDESQKLIVLRDWLLPMLMNGQAIIVD
jgi:type I restriction enzyme S subunit